MLLPLSEQLLLSLSDATAERFHVQTSCLRLWEHFGVLFFDVMLTYSLSTLIFASNISPSGWTPSTSEISVFSDACSTVASGTSS